METCGFCQCGCGKELKKWKNGYASKYLRGHHMRAKAKEKSVKHTNESGLCCCGCGGITRKGKMYLLGHHMKHRSQMADKVERKLCACGCGKYTNIMYDSTREYCLGHHTRGKSLSPAQRFAKYGTKLVESPYIKNHFIYFNKRHKRWLSLEKKGNTKLHSRAVFEHYYGPVPPKYHVHHINGKCSAIEDDRPENLMALSLKWNFRYLPTLASGFGVNEEIITKAYLEEVGRVSDSELFQAVCRNVIETKLGK